MTMQTMGAGLARPFNGEALVGRLFEQTLGAFRAPQRLPRRATRPLRSAGGRRFRDTRRARDARRDRVPLCEEWLEQQATAGILEVNDSSADAELRRYSLPAEHREPLLDGDSLSFAAFMPPYIVSVGGVMQDLLNAFRTGDGLPWDRYGDDMRQAQASANRPLFPSVVG